MLGSDFLQLDLADVPVGTRADALTATIRRAVADGSLPVGTRLPATRVLAAELGCARGTVTEVYRRLTEEGLLTAQRGAGTHIATRPPHPVTSRTGAPVGTVRVRSATGATRSEDSRPEAPDRDPVDLASGVPDLAAFPRAAWLRAERAVLTAATARDLGYAPPAGALALRTELSGWLARSRSVAAGPDQIVVTGGVTGALSLLSQVLLAEGHTTLGVENPGANGNRRILEHWMPGLSPVPVDDEGLVVGALDEDVRAVVVTPAHQYPTGVVLSPARRRALVDWVRHGDRVVIEDDYDAEYRYDRRPVRALHPLAPEHVAYTSSLSKTLAPALRLGWLIPPPRWLDRVVELRWATDLGSPALPQLTLAHLLRSGTVERHLRLMRTRHRNRRDAAVQALHRSLPALAVGGIAAGLHLVVLLPPGTDDERVTADARDLGVLVQPLSSHYLVDPRPGLVLSYAAHHPATLHEAIGRLARAVPRR
ncbi:MAG: PLP-dependent aminotransferase family protein [Cellulomonas sp.]|nr:PLP-dependent aminotransferase family protein [Cellulomonas sp.]